MPPLNSLVSLGDGRADPMRYGGGSGRLRPQQSSQRTCQGDPVKQETEWCHLCCGFWGGGEQDTRAAENREAQHLARPTALIPFGLS